jgi:hypothetical protein
MNKQASLFEGAPKPTVVLRVNGGQRRPLTPAQRTFNTLVARVEKLRLQLSRKTAELNNALMYYAQHLEPRLRRMTVLRKDIVRALEPFLTNGQLKSKADRKTLRTIIAEQLTEIASAEGGLRDDDLRALFERTAGVDFETAQRQRLEDARNSMESIFEDMGFDIDLSDFDRDMTEPDFVAGTAGIGEDLKRQAEQREATHKKTKKQFEREEKERQAEEVRRKSIASIYKQLARVLHPDLESDPVLKQRKEVVMQELTVAYHDNDLHTLLRLELEWIQREQNDINRLTDEKLSIYNQALRAQVRELEFELEDLPLQPRYQRLHVLDGPFEIGVRSDGPAEAKEMDFVINTMERDIKRFRSSNGFETVKTLIREFR